MKRFEKKVAIVIGTANGRGASIVEKLWDEGAKVVALDIDIETLEEKYKDNKDVLCL